MITKERLEELIKEGATIYTIKHNGGDVVELCLKNISDEFWYFLLGVAEELFENKEEVEEKSKKIKWALKYRATRTEVLELPMWEEFCKLCELVVNFEIQITDKNKVAHLLYKSGNYINIWNMDDKTVEFSEKATEENYIKACDLCLKLFEGEENGN